MPHGRAALGAVVLLCIAASTLQAVDITIDCGNRYQQMDGLGAFIYPYGSETGGYYTQPAFVDDYVDDLGNSMVRLEISPDFCPNEISLAEMEDYANYGTLADNGTFNGILVPISRLVQRDSSIKAIGTVWSPPGWMKDNGSSVGGGHLLPEYYEHFARYLYQYYLYVLNTHQIRLYGIGPQNELEFSEPYNSCIYNPQQFHDMMAVVKTYFKSVNCPVKFYGPEDMTAFGDRAAAFVIAVKEDPLTADALDIAAFHGYSNGVASDGGTPRQNMDMYTRLRQYDIPMWMTETSGESPYWEDTQVLPGALNGLAKKMHVAFTYGFVQGWTYWAYGDSSNMHQYGFGPGPLNKKYRVHKHYSKYIRPGAYRVGASPDDRDTIQVSAYYDTASTRLTTVLLNTGYGAKPVNLAIAYGWSVTSFQAFRTRGNENFTTLADVAVDSASRTASFTLPGRSILTLTALAPKAPRGTPPKPPTITCSAPSDTMLVSIPVTLTIDRGAGYYSLDTGRTWTSFDMLYDNGTVTVPVMQSGTFQYYAADGTIETPVYTRNLVVLPQATIAYQQDNNGFVAIEAEGYHTKAPGTGAYAAYAWERTGGPLSSIVMQAQPNDEQVRGSVDVQKAGPVMDYRVHFVKTGQHYLWVRGTGPAKSDHWYNSTVSGGIDDTYIGWWKFGLMDFAGDGVLQLPNDYMQWQRAQFDVPAAGEHQMHFWMRADGFMLDKFEICTDPDYRPADWAGRPAPPTGLSVVSTDVSSITLQWEKPPQYCYGYRLFYRPIGPTPAGADADWGWGNQVVVNDTNATMVVFSRSGGNGGDPLHAGSTWEFHVAAIGVQDGDSHNWDPTFTTGVTVVSATTDTGTGGGHLGFNDFTFPGYPMNWDGRAMHDGYWWNWTDASADESVVGRNDSIYDKAVWLFGTTSSVQDSEPIPGGIGSLNFQVSGMGCCGVGGGVAAAFVNGVEVARAHATEAWIPDVQTYYFPGINVTGRITLSFRNMVGDGGNNGRVIIGNINWTGYSGGAPERPTGLDGAFESDGIHVYWDEAPGATQYRIYRVGKYEGQMVLMDSSATATYYDPDLNAFSPRTYWVTALNGNGESALSDSVVVGPTHCMPVPQQGLWATYYERGSYARTFSGAFDNLTPYARVEPNIDHPATDTIPFGMSDYAVVWVGTVTPQYSEQYTFYATSSTTRLFFGIRVWVDGVKLMDNDMVQPENSPLDESGSITLQAGVEHNIVVQYYQGGGMALQLSWSSPSQARQIIPASAFSTGPPCTPPPPLIEGVTYHEPTTCNTASGMAIVEMGTQTQPGTYDLDMNNDGTYEFTDVVYDTANDRLVIDFSDGAVVTNVTVRGTAYGQVSNTFTTSHTFRAADTLKPAIDSILSYTNPTGCTSADGRMVMRLALDPAGVQIAVDPNSSDTFTTAGVMVNGRVVTVTGFSNSSTVLNPRVQNMVTGCVSPPFTASYQFSSPGTPGAPGTIDGPTSVCPGQTGVAYSVAAVSGAQSYQWTLPAGAAISGAATGASVTVDFSAGATSGAIGVSAVNDCGAGPMATLAVTVGGVGVDTVYFVNPSTVSSTDGAAVVRLSAGAPSGTYDIDLNNDGARERTGTVLAGDSLVVTGYRAGDTVTNVSVMSQSAACPSGVYPVGPYVFHPSSMATLQQPTPVPDGGSYGQRSLTVRFSPMAQDSVADIYYVVCPQQVPCPMTDAFLYSDSIVLDLSGGARALRFEARPKPGQEGGYAPSGLDSALYVYSPRVLGVPVPRPGSGDIAEDTVRVFFETTDQSAIRQVYYQVCADTAGCVVDTATALVYDPAAGILVDISAGQAGLAFMAVPLSAYAGEYEPSQVGHTLYQYRPEYTVVWAAYYDRNADGHIDAARVEFNKDVAQVPREFELTPPSGGAALGVTPAQLSSTLFEADFSSNPFPNIETGFAPGPYGQVDDPGGQFVTTPFTVADSVAPVLLNARYGMSSSAADGIYHDTLVVTYSEPVTVGGTAPFQVFGHVTTFPITSFTVSGATLTALVDVPDSQRDLAPAAGDSLSIAPGSTTADQYGNTQTVAGNRRVPVVVSSPPDFFSAASGPIPFQPPNQYYTIVLRPNERIASLSGDDHARLMVYDATGGVVVEGPFERADGFLRYRWDGRNQTGRLVGQGTYVVVVDLKMSGRSTTKKLKVGVKR